MFEQLKSLNGQLVTVVRPFFGTQSDSWVGEFEILIDRYHLSMNDHSMIFKIEDVKSVERTSVINVSDTISMAVIRLKGPMDYRAAYIS